MAYPTVNLPTHTGIDIPVIFSSKLLVKFYARAIAAQICNTFFEGEIKAKGDSVVINAIPDVDISDDVENEQHTYQNLTPSSQTLLIDKGKRYAYSVPSLIAHQMVYDPKTVWKTDADKQLAIAIDTDLLGTIYSSAHASNAGATAGVISGGYNMGASGAPVNITKANVIDKIVDMGAILDEQNVDDMNRFVVLPASMCALLKSSDLKDASMTGDGQSTVRTGRIGMIDRFTIYMSNLLATTTDGTTSQTVFNVIAGTKDATTFATQLTENEMLPNPFSFGTLFRGRQVYGYRVIKPEALVHGYWAKG